MGITCSALGSSLFVLGLTGCGGRAQGSSTVALDIGTDGDKLMFNRAELRAPAGQPVSLTFHNNSRAMQHNWVLVNGDDAVAKQVSEAGMAAGPAQDYLPTDKSAIVAHTHLLDSGEQETIHFNAPQQPGRYLYLCTFPGHYLVGMRGEFVVEA
jgi:azurin